MKRGIAAETGRRLPVTGSTPGERAPMASQTEKILARTALATAAVASVAVIGPAAAVAATGLVASVVMDTVKDHKARMKADEAARKARLTALRANPTPSR